MSRSDWLVDGMRSEVAVERIYAAAADLIRRDGFDAFSIDRLAERVHCSRATVYRHVGGKAQISQAVTARAAARIADTVRRSVAGSTGAQRVVTAVTVAVAEIRSDPAGRMFIESARTGRGTSWLADSPVVTALATDLAGVTEDPAAAQWVVRLVLSLLLWPAADADTETELLQRFVAPAFR